MSRKMKGIKLLLVFALCLIETMLFSENGKEENRKGRAFIGTDSLLNKNSISGIYDVRYMGGRMSLENSGLSLSGADIGYFISNDLAIAIGYRNNAFKKSYSLSSFLSLSSFFGNNIYRGDLETEMNVSIAQTLPRLIYYLPTDSITSSWWLSLGIGIGSVKYNNSGTVKVWDNTGKYWGSGNENGESSFSLTTYSIKIGNDLNISRDIYLVFAYEYQMASPVYFSDRYQSGNYTFLPVYESLLSPHSGNADAVIDTGGSTIGVGLRYLFDISSK